MAEKRRMTAEEVASDLLTSEHASVVHESVRWRLGQLMEAEVTT
jgi:hypothetical protein